MRLLTLILVPVAIFAAKPAKIGSDAGPTEIFREAVKNYQKDKLATLKYDYTATDDNKGKGEIEVSRVTTLDGTPYERLMSKNGQPLSPDAEKKELEKYQKAQRQRNGETKADRQRRVRKFKEEARFLEEAPDAFDFKMLPAATIEGRDAYVLQCTPKPDFKPRDNEGLIFTKVQAKIWIDKQDLRIIKAEADVVDTAPVGWIVARIAKGSRVVFEQMRLPDGTWVLKTLGVDGHAKILLVDNKKWNETVTYSDYRPASQHMANALR
jgi:hypothetical protein